MTYVLIGCRCLIGVVFLASAMSKLRSRAALVAFAGSVRAMRLLPRRWERPVVTAVVAVELAIPALLALPWGVLPGFGLALSLLGAFTVAIVLAVRRGVRAPCRCFGASAAPLGITHLVRNTLLCVVVVAGALGALLERPAASHPAGVVVAVASGALAAVLVVAYDDLTYLWHATPVAPLPGSGVGVRRGIR